MKIEVVQLENIRSHVKSTVPFTQGFNCVVGGVGCGKSSVMLAVDFALFGDTVGSRSFEYLLKEGCDFCRVTLQFSHNGSTYKLIRGLRRRNKSITQDYEQLKLYEDDKLLASIKTDAIAEQIKAITGLDRDLYREIVWFRQEHLKEILDARPQDRQNRLDKLFGLADYEVAWSNLGPFRRDYENEHSFFQKDPDVNNLEKLNAEYNRSSEDFTLLEMDLEDYSQKLILAKRQLDEAEARQRQLEEKKGAIEELKHKEARLNSDITNTTRLLAAIAQQITDKKALLEGMLLRQSSFESQIKLCLTKLEQTGLPINQPIENLGACLVSFEEKITSLRAEQEATARVFQQDQKRTVALNESGDTKCPVCSQPLVGNYKADLIAQIMLENFEREKTINHLRLEVATLQKTKTIASETISSLQTNHTRNTDLKSRIAEEEDNAKKLLDQLEAQQRLSIEQQSELNGLRMEISRFDLLELQGAKEKREQALKQYYAVQSELQTKENRKKDLMRRLDEVKERIALAQEKVERMEKIRRTVEVLAAVRDAYRSIQPKLRSEFVKVLRNFVQQVLDSLVGGEGPMLNVSIDDTYTPYVKSETGVDREVSNLSGGERTLLAFAYRLGLGQLIMQSRTGHGLGILMLDEPTENLGSEDGSIERLAEAISRFKAIEQIIAVTHSEAFAGKADHVITLEKEASVSRISIER